jgi:hypothetical protein
MHLAEGHTPHQARKWGNGRLSGETARKSYLGEATLSCASVGSVIFSQSVLAVRAGVQSRLSGYCLSLLQIAVFLIPVSLVHFLPNFYYGALLIVIGVDIMHEWLIVTWARVKKAEFVVSWLSFIATLLLTSVLPVQVGSFVTFLHGLMPSLVFTPWHCQILNHFGQPLVVKLSKQSQNLLFPYLGSLKNSFSLI